MKNRQFNFINIFPIFSGHEEFTIAEIHRQFQEAKVQRFAFCMSLHPEGIPARARIAKLTASAQMVMNGVRDLPVELGILIQSTLGHGWSGPVPLTEEPWQNIVNLDGTTSSRMCPSDPDFRQYIFDVIAEVMQLKPAFLIMDDDFGLRKGECVCPNHVRMFNDATGLNFTQEELRKLLLEASEDDARVRKFSEQRDETIVDFAKEIRKIIDRYDPAITCIACTPGLGHSFISDVTHALAGEHGVPMARVNNAVYLGNQPQDLMVIASSTSMIRHQFKDVEELLDEADTFPQNYYSENAMIFHAHLTNAILCGLTGAKLWMSDFENPVYTGSQRKYESIFAENQGFYDTLFNAVNGIRWTGVKHLLTKLKNMNHPVHGSSELYETDWLNRVMTRFAVPIAYDDGCQGGIYALTASVVKRLSDEKLKRLFSQRLLLGSDAVKELTKRGFEKWMGVKAVEDDKFFFQGEWQEGMPLPTGLMWDDNAAKLELIAREATVMSWCMKNAKSADIDQRVAPCMVSYENETGGRIITLAWSCMMDIYKVWKNSRRRLLLKAIEYLNGGNLDMVMDIDQPVMVKHGVMDEKTSLVALISLTVDNIPEIRLQCAKQPALVQMLSPDGKWEILTFRYEKGVLHLNRGLKVCSPLILKIICY